MASRRSGWQHPLQPLHAGSAPRARRAPTSAVRRPPLAIHRAPSRRCLQERDEGSMCLFRVDVKCHDGQARRIAGARLEGPVTAHPHGHFREWERREASGSRAQGGQRRGEAFEVERIGNAAGVGPRGTGMFSRTSCWARTTVPARRTDSVSVWSSTGAPGSSKTTSNTIAAAPPRWRASTSSACWVRGQRFGFDGRPSASAADRSIATTRTSDGGVRGPRSLNSRSSPIHSSRAAPNGNAMKMRPAAAVTAPTVKGRLHARRRRACARVGTSSSFAPPSDQSKDRRYPGVLSRRPPLAPGRARAS